jgi:hypothetical protein
MAGMNSLRTENDRFAPGNPGGPGRPKRDVEHRYLEAISEVASLESWRKIVARAVEDAKQGDARAREWLSRYLIGDRTTVDLMHHEVGQIILQVPDNGRQLELDDDAESLLQA